MPCRRRGSLQHWNVAAISRGAEIAVLDVGKSLRFEHRLRQDAGLLLLAANEKPEYHWPLLDLVREELVVVQRCARMLQEGLVLHIVLELALCDRFEDR